VILDRQLEIEGHRHRQDIPQQSNGALKPRPIVFSACAALSTQR
jgi:hypothetical protein